MHRWDFAKACIFDQFDYEEVTGLQLEFEDGRSDELRYQTYELANQPLEEFERDLKELASRPYGRDRELIQYVYDYLKEHNEWPKTKALRIQLRYLGNVYQMCEAMGSRWIRPGDYQYNNDAVCALTIFGVSLCEGDEAREDIDAFVRVLNYLVKCYIESGGNPESVRVETLANEIGIPESQIVRFSLILREDYIMRGNSSLHSDGTFEFTPSERLLDFEGVQTIQDFFRRHDELFPPARTGQAPESKQEQALPDPQVYSQIFRETMTDPGTLEGLSEFLEGQQNNNPLPPPSRDSSPDSDEEFEYDIALSFAGEQREYVEKVAHALQAHGIRVFYDGYEKATLWGKDLYVHLDEVYRKRARYCLLFASQDYASKVWTSHERQSAQARSIKEHSEYILPARFDDTEIPGLRPTVGYLDLRQVDMEEFVALVLEKIGITQGGTSSLESESAPEDNVFAKPSKKGTEPPPENTIARWLFELESAKGELIEIGRRHGVDIEIEEQEGNEVHVSPGSELPRETKKEMEDILMKRVARYITWVD